MTNRKRLMHGCIVRRHSREIEDIMRQAIKEAAPAGVYTMSSSNITNDSVKLGNHKTMIEATRRYRKYPLCEL